jgi:hypothetical protein
VQSYDADGDPTGECSVTIKVDPMSANASASDLYRNFDCHGESDLPAVLHASRYAPSREDADLMCLKFSAKTLAKNKETDPARKDTNDLGKILSCANL